MKINWLIVFTVIYGVTSCENTDQRTYDFLVYRDNEIKVWTEPIGLEEAKFEDGHFVVKDKGVLLSEGNYLNGFKNGEWLYQPSQNETIKLKWDTYINNLIKINCPSGWDVSEVDGRLFQATFPITSEIQRDKYFVILNHSKAEIGLEKKAYWDMFKEKVFSSVSIKEYAFFELTTDQNVYYFNRLITQRNDEEILLLNFIGDSNDEIFDVTYSSLNDEYEKKHIIFFDMIRSLRIGDQRFFSPFMKLKGMREVDVTDKEDSQSI